MFSRSRFVVGSSKARMPQFKQNVSAKARRMMREANTWNKAGELSCSAQTFSSFTFRKVGRPGLISWSGKGSNVMGSPTLGKSLLFYLREHGTVTRCLNPSRM